MVVDNLANSNEESLRSVKTITGKEVAFYNADIRDRAAMERIFSENTFDAVIHFTGLKAVGESVQKPIEYYDNNLYGTLVLLETMKAHNVKKLVFSSSATVYGTPEKLPLIEGCKEAGVYVYNLGTGVGYSVLDVVHAFEKACGKTLPYVIKPRRAGDIAACYADASKAKRELGWEAKLGIDEMCASLWKWQSMNPKGYQK